MVPFKLIPGVFHLTYVENKGAAFGMLADHRWVFIVISTVAIIALVAYLFIKKPHDKLLCISLALIAGGGIGNMIDRIFRGFVVDMIDVACIRFYVFNVADSAVCIGCGLLTFAIRQFGMFPEGVSIAILTMNLLTPFISDFTKKKTLGGVK